MSDRDSYMEQLERSLAELSQQRPQDDPELARTRDSLAMCYRNHGQRDRAEALYVDVRVCMHLEPVRQYLIQRGAPIVGAGQFWTHNCHMWICFAVVLDLEALRRRFKLPDFVIAHEHRGTHSGNELGLVCAVHHDGLVGGHPAITTDYPVIG